MSPEYAMEGLFSVKSDVYSFGVLVLETVTGLRISSTENTKEFPNLIIYVRLRLIITSAWYALTAWLQLLFELFSHGVNGEKVCQKIWWIHLFSRAARLKRFCVASMLGSCVFRMTRMLGQPCQRLCQSWRVEAHQLQHLISRCIFLTEIRWQRNEATFMILWIGGLLQQLRDDNSLKLFTEQ
jgi:hypothetical protein